MFKDILIFKKTRCIDNYLKTIQKDNYSTNKFFGIWHSIPVGL